MKAIPKWPLLAALVCLGLSSSSTSGADAADDVPSFRTSKDRETKAFVTRVGTAVVKAARYKPVEIELEKFEYTQPATGRHELFIRMSYTGAISKKVLKKKKFLATIKLRIDTSDKDAWEVLK